MTRAAVAPEEGQRLILSQDQEVHGHPHVALRTRGVLDFLGEVYETT